uniref:Uncharacterized protein n=1 Tax=Arundo donax TaxID=35708 RepID=A0A0A8YSP2_ARUDO
MWCYIPVMHTDSDMYWQNVIPFANGDMQLLVYGTEFQITLLQRQ